jgi:hypothetical protein
LDREQSAGEDEVRAVLVQLRLSRERQCRQVDERGAEARNPARRRIHRGDSFDHPQKLARGQCVTAESAGGRRAVNADLLELVDHVARHELLASELFPP